MNIVREGQRHGSLSWEIMSPCKALLNAVEVYLPPGKSLNVNKPRNKKKHAKILTSYRDRLLFLLHLSVTRSSFVRFTGNVMILNINRRIFALLGKWVYMFNTWAAH